MFAPLASRVGLCYFNKSKRFWADKGVLPDDPKPLQNAVIPQFNRFNPDLTVVDDTLEWLGAGRGPWSNAPIEAL